MDVCLIYTFQTEKILRPFSFFDIGKKQDYFDDDATIISFNESYAQCLRPVLDSLNKSRSAKHKVSLFLCGNSIELLHSQQKKSIDTIKKLIEKGKLELLGGPFHNSMSSIFSKKIFIHEVKKHKKIMKKIFGVQPTCMTNSENIFSYGLADTFSDLGFKSVLAPLINWYLGDHIHQRAFHSGVGKLSLLLADHKLHPGVFTNLAKTENFTLRVLQVDKGHEVDEKDWKALFSARTKTSTFITATEAVKKHQNSANYRIPELVALNAYDQDLSVLVGEPMQKELLKKLKFLAANSDKWTQFDLLAELGSSTRFKAISNRLNSDVTNTTRTYLNLMDILSDLELGL